jgi:hypothetical protein
MSSLADEQFAGVEVVSGKDAAAARRAQRRALRAAAPAPEIHWRYDALDLGQVRVLREQLVELQTQVAYWQQILRQRLAVVRSANPRKARVADHTRALAGGAGLRQRLRDCDVWSAEDLVDVPDLVEVWSREVDGGDTVGTESLCADIRTADDLLAELERDLHERHRLATVELLARYRADHGLALRLLP